MRTHFLNTAEGALKLKELAGTRVELFWRNLGGDNEFDIAVIKLVNQINQAEGIVIVSFSHAGDIANDDGVTTMGKFDVVRDGAGDVAESLEIKPDDAIGTSSGGYQASINF